MEIKKKLSIFLSLNIVLMMVSFSYASESVTLTKSETKTPYYQGKVITFVADDLGGKLNARQKEFHLTHKPLTWWKEKLKDIEVFSSHNYDPI